MYTKRHRTVNNDNDRQMRVQDESDDSLSEFEVSEEFDYMKRRKLASDIESSLHQWVDKYNPMKSEEICINPRKLKEVREILSNMISGDESTKLLILAGPPGSSKSTAVKVLANEIIGNTFGTSIAKGLNNSSEKWIEYTDTVVDSTPQPMLFSEFLNDAKYKIGSNVSVVLIEELPNIFHGDTLTRFRSQLNEWVNTTYQLPPLVLCLSEIEISQEKNQDYFNIENNLTVDTLLGREFISQRNIVKLVKFNSIASSFMKKSINRIINEEKAVFRDIPKATLNEFVNYIVQSGDIRSAISNLQFWSGLSTKGRSEIFDSLRETQLSLFHAIGKVIYSSSKFSGLNKEESDYLSVENVLENYGNNSLLNLSLLENYHIYSGLNYDIDIASHITDGLSLSDILNNFEEGREIGVRSTRSQLRRVGERQTQQMNIKFPRHFKMIKEANKTKNEIRLYQKVINECRTSFDNLNLIDGYYLPIIHNIQKPNQLKYGRLGGPFKQVISDGELPVLEEDTGSIYVRDQFQVDINEKINTELEDEELMSDPIETDADSDDDIFNDSIDDTQIHKLVTQSRSQTHRLSSDDDFLSDPELDELILSKNYKM